MNLRMSLTLMNSETSSTSDASRLRNDLTESIDLQKSKNPLALSDLKTWCYLNLLTPETMKLLGSTEQNITKSKNY